MPTFEEKARQNPLWNDLSDAERAKVLTRVRQLDKQGTAAPSPSNSPAGVLGGAPLSTPPAPETPDGAMPPNPLAGAPSPLQALGQVFQGQQRLPFQAPTAEASPTFSPSLGQEAQAVRGGIGAATQQGAEALRRASPVAATVGSAVGQAAVPVAVTAALGPVGAFWETPELLTATLGSTAGEYLNQKLGITPQSDVDLGVAAAAPAGLRGIAAGAQRLIRHLPGAAAGLIDDAVERAHGLVERLRPTPAQLTALRGQVQGQAAQPIAFTNMERVAQGILGDEMRLSAGARSAESVRVSQTILNRLNDLRAGGTTTIPFDDLRQELQRYGARIGELRQAQGIGARGSTAAYNNLRRLYGGILDDIEAAGSNAPPRVGELFRTYRETLRRDFGAQELEHLFFESGAIQERAVDGLLTVNPRRLIQQFEHGRDAGFIRDAFTPQEVAQIRGLLDEMLHLPALPAPAGVARGHMRVLTRVAAAGGLGTALGGPGAGAAAAGLAAIAPEVLSRLLISRPGRVVLRQMMRQGQLPPEALVGIGTMMRIGGEAAIADTPATQQSKPLQVTPLPQEAPTP